MSSVAFSNDIHELGFDEIEAVSGGLNGTRSTLPTSSSYWNCVNYGSIMAATLGGFFGRAVFDAFYGPQPGSTGLCSVY